MSGEKQIYLTLDAGLLEWVDNNIKNDRIWAHRRHAFERMIGMAQKREARGEDLTELE